MKKHYIKLLAIVICVALSFGLYACDGIGKTEEETSKEIKTEQYPEGAINSDPEGMEYDYFFESVEALNIAMKKNPDKYNNSTIKVIGTLAKRDNEFFLVDYTATSSNVPPLSNAELTGDTLTKGYEFHKMLHASDGKIEIFISNDAQYAVAEEGDYVKLYGTLQLTRNSIYIGSCEYDLIATLDERIEMVSQ